MKPAGHISHHHSALAEITVLIKPDLFTCCIQIKVSVMRTKRGFFFIYYCLFNQHSLLTLSLLKGYSRRSLEVLRGLCFK